MSVGNRAGASKARSRGAVTVSALVLSGLALSGCAQAPIRTSSNHGHEYFSQSKYGPASPRVVVDGQPVPRGGGQYLVGHAYTIAGRTYYPHEMDGYSAVGMASWYGDAFHGRRTANGEVYDMRALTAAHPTMPLPSYARVTNTANGYSVIVRVNDRGPYHGGRVMDVSSRVADVLDFKRAGTGKVKVEYVGRAPLEGSDDNELLASLRTDGSAASIGGFSPPSTMVAQQSEPPLSPLVRLIAPAAPSAPPPPPPVSSVAEVEAPAVTHAAILHPPVPPSRPFDLGSLSGLREPPPRPPLRVSSNDRALYFAPTSSKSHEDPFARLLKRVDRRVVSDDDQN